MVTINKIEKKSEKLEQKATNGIAKIEEKNKGIEYLVNSEIKARENASKAVLDQAKGYLKEARKDNPKLVELVPELKAANSAKSIEKFLKDQNAVKKAKESIRDYHAGIIVEMNKDQTALNDQYDAKIESLKDMIPEVARSAMQQRLEAKKGSNPTTERLLEEYEKQLEQLQEEKSKKLDKIISDKKYKERLKEAENLSNAIGQINEFRVRFNIHGEEVSKLKVVKSALQPEGKLTRDINQVVEESAVKEFKNYIAKHGDIPMDQVRAFFNDKYHDAKATYKESNSLLKDLGMLKIVKRASKYTAEFVGSRNASFSGKSVQKMQDKFDDMVDNIYSDIKDKKSIKDSKLMSAMLGYANAYATVKIIENSLKNAKSVHDITNNMADLLKSKDYLLLKSGPIPKTGSSKGKAKVASNPVSASSTSNKQTSASSAAAQASSESELFKTVSIEWSYHYFEYLKSNEWAAQVANKVYNDHPGLKDKCMLNKETVGEAMILWREIMLERKRLMAIPEDDVGAYTSEDLKNAKTVEDAKRILLKDIAYVSVKKVGVDWMKNGGYTDDYIKVLQSISKTSTKMLKVEEFDLKEMYETYLNLLGKVNHAKRTTVPSLETPNQQVAEVNSARPIHSQPLQTPHS